MLHNQNETNLKIVQNIFRIDQLKLGGNRPYLIGRCQVLSPIKQNHMPQSTDHFRPSVFCPYERIGFKAHFHYSPALPGHTYLRWLAHMIFPLFDCGLSTWFYLNEVSLCIFYLWLFTSPFYQGDPSSLAHSMKYVCRILTTIWIPCCDWLCFDHIKSEL